MPRLAADQDSTHWTRIADRRFAMASHFFGRRKIRHIGSMPFAGVNNLQPLPAPRRQQSPVRFNGPAKLGDVVTKHLAKSTRFQEIALHVDDHERAMSRLEFINIRFCVDTDCPFAGHEGSSVEWSG